MEATVCAESTFGMYYNTVELLLTVKDNSKTLAMHADEVNEIHGHMFRANWYNRKCLTT